MQLMNKLVLLRHGQSQWNLENKFTGWKDVPLTEKGIKEANNAGLLLKKGFVDRIIPRKKHREEFSNLISILLHKQINKEDSLSDAQQQDTIHTKSTLSA